MKGLTLNEEPKVGDPDTTRERYGELVPVPNGDAGGAHEQFLPWEDRRIARNSDKYVHAEHNQE